MSLLASTATAASDGDFWATVGLASAVATALATGVSTAAAFLWRWHDRTQADWLFYDGVSKWDVGDAYGPPDPPSATATLSNAGDGNAFRVTVTGSHCEIRLRNPEQPGYVSPQAVIPLLPSGAVRSAYIVCDPAVWDRAAVTVEWTRPPTWKRRRNRKRTTIRLSTIAPRPTQVRTFTDENGVVREEPVVGNETH